jgi:hypothetical protein
MYLQKVISRKQFFVDVLKVKDENSGIRIHWSEVRIRGSGSVGTGYQNVTDPQHLYSHNKKPYYWRGNLALYAVG